MKGESLAYADHSVPEVPPRLLILGASRDEDVPRFVEAIASHVQLKLPAKLLDDGNRKSGVVDTEVPSMPRAGDGGVL
jgi:hypothetical protein